MIDSVAGLACVGFFGLWFSIVVVFYIKTRIKEKRGQFLWVPYAADYFFRRVKKPTMVLVPLAFLSLLLKIIF